jgi:hypothetical protein
MKIKNSAHLLCATCLIALASTASAQTAEPAPAAAVIEAAPVAAAPAEIQQDLMLNAGTPITLAVAEEVNTSTHREGDTFKLTVLNDVSIGQTIVIPRGTPATAEVTWRTGKGAFGKSGKMEFDLHSIDLNGKRIPVNGSFRQEGEGNTVATGVGVIAIGLFAGFITGKRARLPVGRELMSQLAQNVPFTAEGRVANSFDSEAAVMTAESDTPFGKCRAATKAMADSKKQKSALEDCYAERMD